MADDSELDFLRTFLAAVHSAATVKHIMESGSSLGNIRASRKMLLFPGELISAHSERMRKRHLLKVAEDSEAHLTDALNNLQNGAAKLNRRESIDGYSKPSSLCYVELVSGRQAYGKENTGEFYQDIIIEAEWSTK